MAGVPFVNGLLVNTIGEYSSGNGVIVNNELSIVGTDKRSGFFYAGTTNPSNSTRLNYDGHLFATVLCAVSSIETPYVYVYSSSGSTSYEQNYGGEDPDITMYVTGLGVGQVVFGSLHSYFIYSWDAVNSTSELTIKDGQSMATVLHVLGNSTVNGIGLYGSSAIAGYAINSGSNISVSGHVRIAEISTPGTPSAGYGAIYAKTDGILYFKNDAGTEYDLTSGGVSVTNQADNRIVTATGSTDVLNAEQYLTWSGTLFTIGDSDMYWMTVCHNSAEFIVFEDDANPYYILLTKSRTTQTALDGDNISNILSYFYNDAGTPEKTVGTEIISKVVDASDGTEDASITFRTVNNGTANNRLVIGADITIVGNYLYFDNSQSVYIYGDDTTIDVLQFGLNGGLVWKMTPSYFMTVTEGGPAINAAIATDTTVVFIVDDAYLTSGIGGGDTAVTIVTTGAVQAKWDDGVFTLPVLSSATTSYVLYYNTTSKAVSYGAAPSGGGLAWNGSTVNAVGTYNSSSLIDAESTLLYDSTTGQLKISPTNLDAYLTFYNNTTQHGSVGYDYNSSHVKLNYGAITNTHLTINSTGDTGLGAVNPGSTYQLYVTGAIYATGNITANSDIRHKTIIEHEKDVWERGFNNLEVIRFIYHGEEEPSIGYSAQNIQKYFPDAISNDYETDRLGIKFLSMSALNTLAIQETRSEVEMLRARVEELEVEVGKLKNKN